LESEDSESENQKGKTQTTSFEETKNISPSRRRKPTLKRSNSRKSADKSHNKSKNKLNKKFLRGCAFDDDDSEFERVIKKRKKEMSESIRNFEDWPW
jgi:hypothetical protein